MDFYKNTDPSPMTVHIPYNIFIGDYRCKDTTPVLVIEEWFDASVVDSRFLISTLGRVKNKNSNKIVNQYFSSKGYLRVRRLIGDIKVHKIVALVFHQNALNKETVNHKIPDKTINIPSNIEWMTNLENIEHSKQYRIFISGREDGIAPRKGKKILQLNMDGTVIKKWDKMIDINEPIGVSTVCVSLVCRGKQPAHKGFIWRYAS